MTLDQDNWVISSDIKQNVSQNVCVECFEGVPLVECSLYWHASLPVAIQICCCVPCYVCDVCRVPWIPSRLLINWLTADWLTNTLNESDDWVLNRTKEKMKELQDTDHAKCPFFR